MARKIFSTLFTLIFLPIFFITIMFFSLRFSLFNANFYKSTFTRANFYNELLSQDSASILKSLTQNGQNLLGPLSADDLGAAINQSVDQNWAKTEINTTFDQLLNYVTNKSAKISAIYNFADQKKKLIDNISAKLNEKINALPICTSSQLKELQNQDGGNAALSCRPAQMSAADFQNSLMEGLTGKEGLFTKIPDQYNLGDIISKYSFLNSAQRFYSFYNIGSWVALGVSLFLLLIIALINMKNIARMLKWLSIPMLIVSAPILIFSLFGNLLAPVLLSGYLITLSAVLKDLIRSIIQSASGQFFGSFEIIAGAVVLISIIMLIISSILNKKEMKGGKNG